VAARFLQRLPVLALTALMVAGCTSSQLAASSHPPRYEPVGETVVVSADGRVITAIGEWVCDHDSRLVARSYPGMVSVILENPDTKCDANVLGSVPVAVNTRLSAPLGNRALVRVGSTRGGIPYFSERDLATIRRLPFGLRLSIDEPSDDLGLQGQPEIGDTRIYMSPRAILEVTQIVPSLLLSARPDWFGTSCPDLTDWNPRRGDGPCRTVTWVAHGYHFYLGIGVERGMTLTVRELRMMAEVVQLRPGQYRR
jgi:hypothetical protein